MRETPDSPLQPSVLVYANAIRMIMEREVAFASTVADAAIVLDSITFPSLPEESDELVKKRSRGVGLKWEPIQLASTTTTPIWMI